jgi:hypothetical protein
MASCPIRQFGADGDAIRVVAEPEDRQKNHLLEFPQIYAWRHLNCIVVQIKMPVNTRPINRDRLSVLAASTRARRFLSSSQTTKLRVTARAFGGWSGVIRRHTC